MNFIKITTIISLFWATFSFSQTTKVTEYLGTEKSISFNKAIYNLSWSSHPSEIYYKQEYIPKGENSNKFKKMILLEVFMSDVKIKDVVDTKVAELKGNAAYPQVKLISYDVIKKNGETLLDFILTENSADGKVLKTIERDIYRYKLVTDQKGQKGLLLFGISEREYGKKNSEIFLANAKAHKSDLVDAVIALQIPKMKMIK